MKNWQNPNQHSFNYYKIPIALIIVLLVVVVIYLLLNQEDDKLFLRQTDGVEIIVRDSTAEDSQTEKNNQEQSTQYQNLGPATIEELGGTAGSSNIESLLEGKEIEIKK